MQNESFSEKYYVIFENSSVDDWRLRWLKPNFSHVFIAKKSINGYFWIIISPKNGNIVLEMIADCDLSDHFPKAVIIPFKSIVHDKQQIKVCLSTCVEVAKAVLGIRKWWMITPYQLYKYIIRSK